MPPPENCLSCFTARRCHASPDHVVDLCCTKVKYRMCPRLPEISEIMSVILTLLRDFARTNYAAVNRPDFRLWHISEVPNRLNDVRLGEGIGRHGCGSIRRLNVMEWPSCHD
jgi:hypothetical protein